MRHQFITLMRDDNPAATGGAAPPPEAAPSTNGQQAPPAEAPPGETPTAEAPPGDTPPPADALPTEELSEEEQFWSTVAAEHGIEPEELEEVFRTVEDPLSPAAIVAYGNSLVERTREAVIEQIKEEDPRAYAYRLHRRNGGSDEDFLDPKSALLPARDKLENDIPLQKAYYKQSLTRNGLEPEQADILIEDAARKGVLKERSFRALDTDEARERQLLEQLEAEDKAANDNLTRTYQSINNTLRTVVEKGDGLRINIPAASRQVFTDFLNSRMVHDGRNFMFALPINQNSEELRDIIQGLYLMFNKSDVSKMMLKKGPEQTGPRARLGGAKIAPPASNPPVKEVEEAEFTVSSMLRGPKNKIK